MASTKSNGENDDWEYEDEEADDYEWEYTEGEEEEESGRTKDEDVPLAEQELPDPFSSAPLEATTKKDMSHSNDESKSNGERKKHRKEENGEKKHRKKKSRHMDRIEALSKRKDGGEGENRTKKIHVRSKDPSRIARQFEKSSSNNANKSRKDSKRPPPPQQKVNQICKICGKEPYLVERIVAEKSWWHKNCFRCHQCKKSLNLDTYVSHEGIIYCRAHHKELFQPKTIKSDIIDVDASAMHTHEAVLKHQEQARRMETIVRENNPVELKDVVKCNPDGEKYSGLEHLDVGSKFKMFESGGDSQKSLGVSSDRYGIMEKLKRLQDGEDLDELLAEIDEELPSSEEEEDEIGMTNVQKKTHHAEKLFEEGGQDRRNKLAEERKKELKLLRKKLTGGTRDSIMEAFDDMLTQKDSKIKKTKVDVRSENAKKFRDMFDKGEVPEATGPNDKSTMEKNQELELMRNSKREQLEFFKQMEEGKLEEKTVKPKLLVGKIRQKDDLTQDGEDVEMSLSNKFTFFENFEEKQEEMARKSRRPKRSSPSRSNANNEGEEEEEEETRKYMSETEIAKRECKARSVLNKFKDMEQKALNGEDINVKKCDDPDKPVMTALGFLGRLPGVGERPRLKQFTPPRRYGTSDSESEYSDSDYTDSYTDDSSYTDSESQEEEEDETLRAIRAAARAKELRAKFEEWEDTQDAKEQMRQMMIHDENGDSLETATNLKAKFESMKEVTEDRQPTSRRSFRVKRFK